MTDLECLKVIEFLVSVDEDPNHEAMERIIHDVYLTVHSHLEMHSCYSVHEDWRKRGEELLNEAKQVGFIK